MMKTKDDESLPSPALDLDQFRESWQRELKAQNELSLPIQNTRNEATTPEERQDIAEDYFQKAVELERKGKVYDALPLYKKAVQLVPDIEKIYYERQKLKAQKAAPSKMTQRTHEESELDTEFLEYDGDFDLYEKFKTDLSEKDDRLLLSNCDAGVISTRCHISEFPPEILFNILRWVVSNQLDLASLENCARVSKGMYLFARDEELWRSACVNVWGADVGTPDRPGCTVEDISSKYSSWRQMYIERTRVLYNGCYISKTTYLRMGENSFQDQYYRPIQLVEYFRYIRFLPDGTMYMMTSAEEPANGVTKLRNINNIRPDVLRGNYFLKGNVVSCLLRKQQPQRLTFPRQRRGSIGTYVDELVSLKYHMEFKILSTSKRKFSQLIWQHYSLTQIRNKIETSSLFEISSSKYPPLWFSPVRSYHLEADAPLV